MSELGDRLVKLLEQKDEKNYDPRMEELMRSDRLLDPKAENLSKLEDQEIFHVAKIRGAQLGFSVPVKTLKEIYNRKDMLDYHCDYIDMIRNADAELEKKKIGGLPMTNEMVQQLVYLRGALEGWKAKLYADSIKPVVANQPVPIPQFQEEKEGFFSKFIGFFFGKKKQEGGERTR